MPMHTSVEHDPIALRILGLLLSNPHGLSFTDIVRAVGKPKETVNKRLKMLVEYGLVEKRKQGRKTIYKVSEKSIGFVKTLRTISATLHLFLLDHLKAFVDLVSEGYVAESHAALCAFGNVFASFFAGGVASIVNAIESFARKMLENGESLVGIRKKLINLATLLATRELMVLDVVPVAIAAAVVEGIAKGVKLNEKNSFKLLFELCRDEKKRGELWKRALDLLSHTMYAKRLRNVYERAKEVCREDDDAVKCFKVLYEVYSEAVKNDLAEIDELAARYGLYQLSESL